MSIEAMWQVTFGANSTPGVMVGAGIVVLETGRVFGGDSSFYCTGNYRVDNEIVFATIRVRRHTPGLQSIFGMDDVTLTVRAPLTDAEMWLDGAPQHAPHVHVVACLKRLEELP